MTRAECEAKLMEHMEAMVAILHEYNPGSTYLYSCYSEYEGSTFVQINNAHFDDSCPEDKRLPLHCHKFGGKEMVSDAI
jgi:hypothetical protein